MADNFKSDYFNMPVHVSICHLGHFGEGMNIYLSLKLLVCFHHFLEKRTA